MLDAAFGIALLDCNRGTNNVEAIHKQLVAPCGTWCTGVEMSDALLLDRCHRYNQTIKERKWPGFFPNPLCETCPRIGYCTILRPDVDDMEATDNVVVVVCLLCFYHAIHKWKNVLSRRTFNL
jgi:hypothetical protein